MACGSACASQPLGCWTTCPRVPYIYARRVQYSHPEAEQPIMIASAAVRGVAAAAEQPPAMPGSLGVLRVVEVVSSADQVRVEWKGGWRHLAVT